MPLALAALAFHRTRHSLVLARPARATRLFAAFLIIHTVKGRDAARMCASKPSRLIRMRHALRAPRLAARWEPATRPPLVAPSRRGALLQFIQSPVFSLHPLCRRAVLFCSLFYLALLFILSLFSSRSRELLNKYANRLLGLLRGTRTPAPRCNPISLASPARKVCAHRIFSAHHGSGPRKIKPSRNCVLGAEWWP